MPIRKPINLSIWNEWVMDYMMDAHISQAQLAQRLGLAPGSVQSRISGISPPPLGHMMRRWMDELRLDDGERDVFRHLAYLGHCAPEVRAYFDGLLTGKMLSV